VEPSCEKKGEKEDEEMWSPVVKRKERKRMKICGVESSCEKKEENEDEVMWCPAVNRREEKGFRDVGPSR
jgi:hypothetical protein